MLTLVIAAGAMVAFSALVVLAYRRRWQWTGLPAAQAADDGSGGRPARTLWDWLQLLGIPLALAALAFLLSEAQDNRDYRRSRDADRESALRAYLAQMSDLMLKYELLKKPPSEVKEVARTATLTTVRRLDGVRKGVVVRLLVEAHLLEQPNPTVPLREADLTGAFLEGADLRGADLAHADLRGANLVIADLTGANLDDDDLDKADLTGTNFAHASLRRAAITNADLGGACFVKTDLSNAIFVDSDIDFAHFSGAVGADLDGAHGKPEHDNTCRGEPVF
jgi:uncharacterized protein YjbI with pentapeptide repeats